MGYESKQVVLSGRQAIWCLNYEQRHRQVDQKRFRVSFARRVGGNCTKCNYSNASGVPCVPGTYKKSQQEGDEHAHLRLPCVQICSGPLALSFANQFGKEG